MDKINKIELNNVEYEIEDLNAKQALEKLQAKSIEWNESSRLNTYIESGVYDISGLRLNINDDLPITNVGENSPIAAKLFVTATPEGTTVIRHIFGQTLILSNAEGNETNIYTRSGKSVTSDNSYIQWSNWEKLQGIVETYFNLIDSGWKINELSSTGDTLSSPSSSGLNGMVDNGMYSGIFADKLLSENPTFIETFVLVVINDYAISNRLGVPRRISQLKYATDVISGKSSVKMRLGTGNENITWGDWTELGNGNGGGGDITAEDTDGVVSNIEENVVASALRKTPQVLTESEKLQARENIDAQKELTLTIKDNGNIVIGDIQGESKEFMPATPSGDPMHYAYIAAGAEYNDTGADKTKTAPWGETVIHKAGHYYLNGLGDITEEQMRDIYNAGEFKLNIGGFYTNNKKIRTFIPAKISGQEGYGAFNISGILCNATSIESVVFTESYNLAEKYGIAITSSIPYASFSGCSKLVYIQNINLSNLSTTTNLRDAFKNCNSLVYAKLNGLKCNLDWSYSKDISQDSVLYTIQNAVPTSAITITLHHDAYARLTSDQEVLDALTEKNADLATEGKGGKISLVCATDSDEIIPNA